MATNLNPQQKNAAESPMGALLIAAGAGTGKTRTLISRLLYILSLGTPARSVCALTFTNKAAREMKERALGGGYSVDGAFIGTFHGFGARILRDETPILGRTNSFAIYDDSDSMSLLRKTVRSLVPKGPDNKPIAGAAFFRNSISAIKSSTRPARDFLKSGKPEGALVPSVLEDYEMRLSENNAFDFDDLIQKVVHIFEERPDILEKYRARFTHILIDEYQDLNTAQYELLRLLARNARSVSAVGDDAQMIYGWRGSNINTFINFEKDWPNTRTAVLEENYRSTNIILAAASAVIRNNTHQSASTLSRELWTKNGKGESIKIFETLSDEDEARTLVREIAGRSARDSAKKETTAIVYRTNAQSRPIEQALIYHEIPYTVYGGLTFYARREVKDAVAALRYACNPKDTVSAERLLKLLNRQKFSDLREALLGRNTNNPRDVLELFFVTTEYVSYLDRVFTDAFDRKQNLNSLTDFASQFEDVSGFLERISLLEAYDSQPKKKKNPSVLLMTMHLSKGLEFERVIVAGASEGVLPHARSLSTALELEEERRLMYVAMTRARNALSIYFYGVPSRFISEIPAEYTTFSGGIPLDHEERYITID